MIFRIAVTVTLISLAFALIVSLVSALLLSGRPAAPYMMFISGFFLMEALLLVGVFERRAPVFGKIFWRGSTNLSTVAITFDDGPNEPFTSAVLDILAAWNVKATFFVLGENAERYPEALRRMVREGHEIGNHTWDHAVLPLKSRAAIRAEIEKTSAVIRRICGIRPRLFRAPHGWRNPWLNSASREAGCIPVAWTLGVWDTDRPGADVIVRRTVKGIGNGCVLLLHDGRGLEHPADSSQLVSALPVIFEKLRAGGYEIRTLSRMIVESDRQ